MSYLVETSIPELHRNWDIQDLVGADNLVEIQQKVSQYLHDPELLINGNNLYIYSIANGTGKTRIAYYILNALSQPRLVNGNVDILSTASVTFGEYLKFCNDAFNADSKAARKLVMTVPVLLLDDVSPVFCTSNPHKDKMELTLLMMYRRSHLLPTILTSNLVPTEFEKTFGSTAASKALENFSYIEILGADVRPVIYPDQLGAINE